MMNSSEWISNSTSSDTLLLPGSVAVVQHGLGNVLETTEGSHMLISNKPCGEALSSQTPAAVKLPGSLDALLYIVIVLMFYAFSIIVLMVKYIRREREEANLRHYYHEFVSRDKFRSAQYKNKQFMNRIFGKGWQREDQTLSALEEEVLDAPQIFRGKLKQKDHSQTLTKSSNNFSRLVMDGYEERATKESFTFLGAKNQFCKSGFFGKKFCNKQLCSKCVSESAPTIDWGDDKADTTCDRHIVEGKNTIEVKLFNVEERPPIEVESVQKSHLENYCRELDPGSLFCPIIECESEREEEEMSRPHSVPTKKRNEDVIMYTTYETACEEPAVVSSCSLEVSELLANMPPLGTASTINDMDTLDGLSNLESEAESQSLLSYSASIKGITNFCGLQAKDTPGIRNKSASGEDRLREFSDFLSERTSLLSCTLSIEDGEDEDVTNISSSKHLPNGLMVSNSSNGKVKDDFRNNGKCVLNSLSKSMSSDKDEVMRFLSDITVLSEESGVFKNLKYFLKSFSKHEEGEAFHEKSNLLPGEAFHEKSNLLPRETYFGPGSPKSFSGDSQSAVVPITCDSVKRNHVSEDLDTIDDDLLNVDDCIDYGNRWGYTYDEEDEIYSDGDRSSSFGEYCMGETNEVIDLSKPLSKRQLDPVTKDGLSRSFVGLEDPWTEVNKPNPMLAGYGSARKETKV